MAKYGKREKLEDIRDILLTLNGANQDLIDFLNEEIELVNKKNAPRPRKTTP